MSDFVSIKLEDVPADGRGRALGQLGTRATALLAGETIWLPGPRASYLVPTLKRRGYQLHTRKMTHEGVAGFAYWAEKVAK